MTIGSQLTWSFTLEIAVLLGILGAVAFGSTRAVVEARVSEAAVVGLTQTERNFETVIGGASDLSLFVLSNRNVRLLLGGAGDEDALTLDRTATLTDDLANLAGSKSAVLAINIYGANGLRYETAGPSTSDGKTVPDDLSRLVPPDGTALVTPPYERNYQTLGQRHVLSFCRRLLDVNHLTRGLGWLRIDLSEDAVAAFYRGSGLGRTGEVFIANGQGLVVSHDNKSLLGKNVSSDPVYAEAFRRTGDGYGRVWSKGVELLVASHRDPQRGYVFVSVVPFRELTRDADQIGVLLLLAVLGALAAAFLVSRTIARRITDPIPALMAQMRAVEQGDWEARVDAKSNNELGVLGRSFNQMTTKLKALIEEVYTSQIIQREAELKALQAQINPHFLYNTLDAIYWTAQLEKAPQSAQMVQALAQLFKLGLNHGQEFTTVGREVEHLNSYLVLQRVRFDTPPEVAVDVDEALSPCVTPKLILQPLVENAFVHGLAGVESGGRISVMGRCEDRGGPVGVFVVEDNGAGMGADRIREVLSESSGNRDSYGLKNVDESLKLFFGPEYGLTIESTPGKGTRVTLVLPRTTERPRRRP